MSILSGFRTAMGEVFFSYGDRRIDLWHDRDCNSWHNIKVEMLFTFRCNSQLGMVGGEQILNLDINGCRWVKNKHFTRNLNRHSTFIPRNLSKLGFFFRHVFKNLCKHHQTLMSSRQCKPLIFENVKKVSLQ